MIDIIVQNVKAREILKGIAREMLKGIAREIEKEIEKEIGKEKEKENENENENENEIGNEEEIITVSQIRTSRIKHLKITLLLQKLLRLQRLSINLVRF